MKIKINPTRMELLKLKKRIVIAKRGHKLLKDKEEQLLVEFRKLIEEVKKVRKETEEEIYKYYQKILILRGITEEKKWESLLIPFLNLNFHLKKKRIFNIPVNEIEFEVSEKIPINQYLSPYYNYLIKNGIEILKKLFYLFQLENKLISFSEEIERTRRRVNALEYVLIPNIQNAINFIQLKLDEYERSSLVKLKHIKLIRES